MNKILGKRGYKENFEKLSKSQNSLRELCIKPAKNKSYSKFSINSLDNFIRFLGGIKKW